MQLTRKSHAEVFPSSTPGDTIRVSCFCDIGHDHDHDHDHAHRIKDDTIGHRPSSESDWKDALPGRRFTIFHKPSH
jgi:hypothetical protein